MEEDTLKLKTTTIPSGESSELPKNTEKNTNKEMKTGKDGGVKSDLSNKNETYTRNGLHLKKRYSMIPSLDFRNDRSSSMQTERKRSQSVVLLSAGGQGNPTGNGSRGRGTAVLDLGKDNTLEKRKTDVELNTLEVVTGVSDTVSNNSKLENTTQQLSADGFYNKVLHQPITRPSPRQEPISIADCRDGNTRKNRHNSDLNGDNIKENNNKNRIEILNGSMNSDLQMSSKTKAAYVSTSYDSTQSPVPLFAPRPKSILNRNRASSAVFRPVSSKKKVSIVDNRRPKSCYPGLSLNLRKFNENFGRRRPISAQEYLPRKSFFSCHDNALSSAGINPRDLSDLNDATRKKNVVRDDDEEDDDNTDDSENQITTDVKSENISTGTQQRPDHISIPPTEETRENFTSISLGDSPGLQKADSVEDENSDVFEESTNSTISSVFTAVQVARAVNKMKNKAAPKFRSISSSLIALGKFKALVNDEYENKNIKVDPKIIIEYLKLVKERPNEYIAMRKETGRTGTRVIDNLVNTGMVYGQGKHHLPSPENMVVQAAYELGSRSLPKVCRRYEAVQTKLGSRRTKSGWSQSSVSSKPNSATSRSKSKMEKGVQALSAINAFMSSTADCDESGWTELKSQMSLVEKKRAEVELWLRKLNTAQMVKAREMALKELGEEDASIRRWWYAHKYCRYLRKRIPAEHVLKYQYQTSQ